MKKKTTLQKIYFLYIILIAVLAMSFYLDTAILNIFESLKNHFLGAFFSYITYLGNGLVLSIILIILLLFSKKKKDIFFLLFTIFLSASMALIIKSLITRPRPENILVSINLLLNYSFPSMHTVLAFSVLPLLNRAFSKFKWPFTLLAFLVLLSRIYLKLHYFSDVAFGAVIGYLIGMLMIKFRTHEFFTKPSKFARQFFHAGLGILIAYLIFFGFLTNLILVALILIGLTISFISLKVKIPIISWFLKKLERKENIKKLPGKGVITYLIGALLANILFKNDIAAASLMILALGDPVSHIIGRYYGATKSVFSKKKFLEGTIIGIFSGFAGAVFFVSPLEAFIASLIAMIVEAIEIRFFWKIDDNIVIPAVAGGVIYIIRMII